MIVTLQLWLAWLWCPQVANILFAVVCVFAAFGMCPRRVAILSALLYVALAFM